MAETDPINAIDDVLSRIVLPDEKSHKGQNGRLLIIGGSRIFHAAAIWAANAASKLVDYVHFSSTKENNEIFVNLKSKFVDGIVVPQSDLQSYVEEDDCILMGPGMERGSISDHIKKSKLPYDKICKLENEADYTYALIRFLIEEYPDKKFVFDAAALQMMNKEWLKELSQKPIVTPHVKEFEILFGVNVSEMSEQEKEMNVKKMAQEYNCIVLMKNVTDYITDGDTLIKISGGNAGLAKGGSGDALAGLVSAFNTKNDQMDSCIISSYLVKSTAEDLYKKSGLLYNATDLISSLSYTAKRILYN